MTDRTAHCALAFIRRRPDNRQALAFLQCASIHFDGHGAPVTWNMSTLRLERECVLARDARPMPRYTKFRMEPHYWFPNTQELERIARALSPQPATDFKAEVLRSTIRPSRTATPPHMAPPFPVEHRMDR